MEAHKIIFFGIGILAIAFIQVLFIRFMKWLGDQGGDWSILKDNYRILIQFTTMIVFAVLVAVLMYLYQAIYHDLFNF